MFGLVDVCSRYVTFGMEMQNALNVHLGVKHVLECFMNYDSHLVPPFQRVLFLSLGNIVVNFFTFVLDVYRHSPDLRHSYVPEGPAEDGMECTRSVRKIPEYIA